MLSHELAKALLARRNNDIKICVVVTEQNKESEFRYVDLADSEDNYEFIVDSENVVRYDSMADAIVIYMQEKFC